MKTPSLTKSLPALISLTGGALLATGAHAVTIAPKEPGSNLEARIEKVRSRLQAQHQPGVDFAQRSTDDGLQTFWWGNWHNGGWGPGMWHNWGNGGWRNWGNGWGNGGWHNWHNWGNW